MMGAYKINQLTSSYGISYKYSLIIPIIQPIIYEKIVDKNSPSQRLRMNFVFHVHINNQKILFLFVVYILHTIEIEIEINTLVGIGTWSNYLKTFPWNLLSIDLVEELVVLVVLV